MLQGVAKMFRLCTSSTHREVIRKYSALRECIFCEVLQVFVYLNLSCCQGTKFNRSNHWWFVGA
jgi:hypothetical protein